MSVRPLWLIPAWIAAAAGAAACTGVLGERFDGGPGAESPGAEAEGELRLPLAHMRRLTRQQYLNSVGDVFGAPALDALAGGERLPIDRFGEDFSTLNAAHAASSEREVELYRDAALNVAEAVLAAGVGGCAPSGATDPCIEATLRSFGRLLWRRALTGEELARLTGLVTAAATHDASAELEPTAAVRVGLRYALAALLQSPHFLYVAEVGELDPDTGIRRFTGPEMASRLSYFLWNSTPDEALLAAAERGELGETTGLEAQVERLLADPRGQRLAVRFFGENWGVDKLGTLQKDPVLFPEWTPSVAVAARQEFDRVLTEIAVDPSRDFLEIFTGKSSLVNRELGALYGVEVGGTDFERVELGEMRFGLLTSVAVLAANANPNRTSPTHRGMFLRWNTLCAPVPPPPAGVSTELEEAAAGKDLSIRERLELHRTEPACANCHALFDPLGMTLESFDAVGRYRTEEAPGMPVDPSAEFEGQLFRDVRDLAAFLEEDPRTAQCLVRRMYGYAVGHHATEGEEPLLSEIYANFAASGRPFRELVRGIVTSAGFRSFRPEADL
jgi:hypothetical protein